MKPCVANLPLGSLERAVLELLYGTAVRGHEIVLLKVSDVDLENGRVTVSRRKQGWSRVIFLPPSAAAALRMDLAEERSKNAAATGKTNDRLFLDHERLNAFVTEAGW